MDRRSLEQLLLLGGSTTPVADASMTTCGCLVSELAFLQHLPPGECPLCHLPQSKILAAVEPLRELWRILDLENDRRRRSLSRQLAIALDGDAVDMMGLFQRYANEENQSSFREDIFDDPILKSLMISSNQPVSDESLQRSRITMDNLYEQHILNELTEEKEYNYSLCFPLHRKRSDFDILKRALTLNNVLKKGQRYISLSICTRHHHGTNVEVTMFAMITEKRWELYEYTVPINVLNLSHARPQLICCGKATGEFGELEKEMQNGAHLTGEIVIHSDLPSQQSAKQTDIQKRLQQWEFVLCELTPNHLVISGTKGLVRVFNILKSPVYKIGQPVYTYVTNFPIKCIAVASSRNLIATGVTAKERLLNKEQPFIILHKLTFGADLRLKQVDPITITIPYHEPIRHICFNEAATHLMCTTSWELRYLIIRLRQSSVDNYRKPRLIFTGFTCSKGNLLLVEADLIKTSEGITDIRFGVPFSNTVFINFNALKQIPPMMIHLEGAMIDSLVDDDGFSLQHSMTSMEESDYITAGKVMMKFTELGSLVHRCAVSPRGDGVVFLSKDGRLVLVNTTNFHLALTMLSKKKFAVLLGEVAGSERSDEAGLVEFSKDGGKVFVVDRKGVFSIFDFTKGVPGKDHDVIKCKIVRLNGSVVN